MHRLIFFLIALVAAMAASRAETAPEIRDLINRLEEIDCYEASVDYSVTLPQAQDDIRYSIVLESRASKADTLSPADYIIDWTFRSPAGVEVNGFSAYYEGHHYRFRGDKLLEYHTEWDPHPFATRYQNGHAFPGVQRSVQFGNLLPAMIALDLKDMAADSLYTLTVTTPDPSKIKLRTVMTVNGLKCLETTYTFSAETMLPLAIDTDANVGTISEQTMTARYTYSTLLMPCPEVTEQQLIKRWPDIFTRYRESNFRIENLPGTPLPAFTLPRPEGGRITRVRGQAMSVPTAIVILDPAGGFTRETVTEMRKAAQALPFEPEILWAVTSTNPETTLSLVAPLQSGEAAVMNASGLARDCGAASLPVVILCDTTGTVRDVVTGFNKDLASIVIQKMSLLK